MKARTFMTLVLAAIQTHETGGEKDPANAIGDDGRAVGWYQIHAIYVKDCNRLYAAVGGESDHWKLEDRHDFILSSAMVEQYLTSYGYAMLQSSASLRVKVTYLARLHNGGPKGPEKDSTWKYGQAVYKHFKAFQDAN